MKQDRLHVKTLVTVTTDLGESFYNEPCHLHIAVLSSDHRLSSCWSMVHWKPDSRVVWVESGQIPSACLQESLTLLVSSKQAIKPDVIGPDCNILSARCEIVLPSKLDSSTFVQRALQSSSCQLRLYEEMGESIARHVWYALITGAQELSSILAHTS